MGELLACPSINCEVEDTIRINSVDQLLGALWCFFLLDHGLGTRCRRGSTVNSAMHETVILTEFDSSSQTYRSTWMSSEMVAATRENSPTIVLR
jgi:hypothetical protein